MNRYRQIAQIMCSITMEVLLPRASYSGSYRRHSLTCEVGSGRATYHRQQGNKHLIRYGQKMVEDKHNQLSAERWLSYRELKRSAYFEGEISLLNLLAHTVCHEFAHYEQSIAGLCRRGSIHNAGFYQILSELYSNGCAERVRDILFERCRSAGLALAFESSETQAKAEINFSLGQELSFTVRGEKIAGRVLRVNKHSLSIRPLDPSFSHIRYYRVPKQQFLSDLDIGR